MRNLQPCYETWARNNLLASFAYTIYTFLYKRNSKGFWSVLKVTFSSYIFIFSQVPAISTDAKLR